MKKSNKNNYEITQTILLIIISILCLIACVAIKNFKNKPIKYEYYQYTVQQGDTLWNIAKENNVSLDIQEYIYNLEQLNNCTPNLKVGQKLTVMKEV